MIARGLLSLRRGRMPPWFHARQTPEQWIAAASARQRRRVHAIARGRAVQAARAGRHNRAHDWLQLMVAAA